VSSADRDLACLCCGGPLPGREGEAFRKYFLVDRAIKRQRHSEDHRGIVA
jgi:hypothetical protein